MKKSYYAILSAALLIPTLVSAQNIIPNNPLPGQLPGDSTVQLPDLIIIIIQALLGIAGLVAVLFIIIGGFRYITSAGNDEQAAAGKKTLTNAIIGLIVIILSYVIVVVVANALTS